MAAKWISYTATKLEMIPFDTWVAWCRVLDESYRELGIEMNKRTIERCDVFVMFGGRISDGMKLELEHAKLMGLEIMDLTPRLVESMNVQALFIDPKGVYPRLLGDENCWDFERDARTYQGSDPVIAHPPCNLWVNMAQLNYRRYGGDHNKPGNDSGKFASALDNVMRVGGVLEHPAGSMAFEHFRLPKPRQGSWQRHTYQHRVSVNGRYFTQESVIYVCEVSQATYGCRAQKLTWLLFRGNRQPTPMNWTITEGTHQIGWFDRKKPTLSKREASHTPEKFATALIELAKWSR
jgi:hypothetical protein